MLVVFCRVSKAELQRSEAKPTNILKKERKKKKIMKGLGCACVSKAQVEGRVGGGKSVSETYEKEKRPWIRVHGHRRHSQTVNISINPGPTETMSEQQTPAQNIYNCPFPKPAPAILHAQICTFRPSQSMCL